MRPHALFVMLLGAAAFAVAAPASAGCATAEVPYGASGPTTPPLDVDVVNASAYGDNATGQSHYPIRVEVLQGFATLGLNPPDEGLGEALGSLDAHLIHQPGVSIGVRPGSVEVFVCN